MSPSPSALTPTLLTPDYESWTKEQLIARLTQLESHPSTSHRRSPSPHRAAKPPKPFHFAKHPQRKIALKFTYAGWEYNGLAWQNGPTPLPTVEGALFDMLAKTKLVDEEGGLEGCGWERCGRTDKGVSAAGQVVSLWVRSAVVDERQGVEGGLQTESEEDGVGKVSVEEKVSGTEREETAEVPDNEGFESLGLSSRASSSAPTPTHALKRKTELRYIWMLNRLLPPSIRVLAWSPVAPTFSARFNCRFRHYKYFFSAATLDVDAMCKGAERLVGEHDFRNMCKLDPTKQITNFKRRVLRADISPVSGSADAGIYVFDLVGSAFLYHQVRHIMAVLFLVGTGLERPSLVTALLNTDKANPYPPFAEGDEVPSLVECKPEYQMADGLPLMLWDCGYAEEDLDWRTDLDTKEEREKDATETTLNLYHQLDSIHTRSLISTTLDEHFLSSAGRFHAPPPNPFPLASLSQLAGSGAGILNVPLGGGTFRRLTKYVPVLERNRLDSIEVANERWRLGKGGRREERKRAAYADAGDDGDE
ncbi:hypothetical protein EW146_g2720 [Bondarzewia mesenterica]|uniref:Pseudouridine synthase I TruA alpha/beta domain-containing protein n=1 Tax=Bondarzewia mesenterica TaxID=1095465 RepID=A0A4S4M1B4_9AGAM|nr:hypothetical protein EW146_g2720 [Bondarzewia mesenterica]